MSALLVPDELVPDDAESVLRLNRGGPESESEESFEFELERGRGAAIVAESPEVISALGVPSSEPETARRILGGPSVLFEGLEELLDDAFDELLVSPELDARRNRGRSGSSSDELEDEERDDDVLLSSELDELDDDDLLNTGLSESLLRDELLLSSEFDARRNTGRSPPPACELDDELDETDELDDEPLEELAGPFDALSGLGSGCVGSSAASDAAECSSAVPSLTRVIV
ncbi:MAG TPA: hypothetical protein VGL82_07840 [Bryobacteraceae bacterium]